MGEQARDKVVLADFPGLASKPDSDDITPGASQVQVNVQSSHPGELRVRPGYRELTFEEN